MGKYIARNVGDIIANGAVLVERVDGRRWKIKCSCGNIFISQPSCTSGYCRQCGYKHNSLNRTMHGESPSEGRNASRLYCIWLGMRNRCRNKKNKNYSLYGGRGISICSEWNDYLLFKKWALANGYCSDLTLDRINVNGDYEPDNCRWVTQQQQCRNKRDNHLITFDGVTRTMAEWSEITGIPYHTLKSRINRYGFTIDEALTLPVNAKRNQRRIKHGQAKED